MAGIIKNQILKHLSRYVKKLSSDRINVSTLKGEGELSDLELDEEVLTELLALPIWMKVKKAHCNRARLMIQWTKLKSIPIKLILDTIEIQIEACEELRPVMVNTPANATLTLPTAGKYGFVNKVVDGITVTVEAVEIKFFSKAFESKVQISRILVESKSPQWKRVELPHTRLKDMEKGELLTFKEIEWQTLRLEAQSTKEKHLAPLRLLTNQAKARVVIKKKLCDCSIIGVRLSLILDDLLWVLTDSQILAAAHFMSSLSGLVKQATEMSQAVKSVRKLETLPEFKAQQSQANSPQERTAHSDSARIFDAFDVKETSYHLVCEKIDLHFCDDPGGGRSNHPDLRDGGAGQLQLTQLMVDFYPYHLAKADRRYWFKYSNNDLYHWLKESLVSFHADMMNLFPKSVGGSGVVASQITEQMSKLMSTCLVVKIRDICLYKVTTSSRETPTPFLCSYLERPKDISAVNMEFTWFYYPGATSFPLPSPKFFSQINPLQIQLDICTVLWLNSFVTNIQNSLPTPNVDESDYLDVRLELVMPKVVIEEKLPNPGKERPTALQVQASRIVVANYRSGQTGTKTQLSSVVQEIERFHKQNGEEGASVVYSKFKMHCHGKDCITRGGPEGGGNKLTTNMLWTEARDVWSVTVDTVWADFCVEQKPNQANEPKRKFRSNTITSMSEASLIPFVDSIPVAVWLYIEEEPVDREYSMGNRKDIKALLRVDGMCNVQMTHQQYLFILRAAEAISEISLFLTVDTRKTYIVPRRDDSVDVVGCLPRVELSLILPYSDNDVKESSLDAINESASEDHLCVEFSQNTSNDEPQKWDIPLSARDNNGGIFAPESPEKFYSDLPAATGPSSLNSVDALKTSISQGMKHGISNLVVSFNKGGGHSTPDSEVTSLWSTDSSESNFITLDPEQDLPNYQQMGEDDVEDAVEVAEEVIEDNSQSTGSFSIHNPYGRDDSVEISVLTVTLNGLKFCQHSEGISSQIQLFSKFLSVDESDQIPWKDFQTLFATRSKKWRTDHDRCNFKTDNDCDAITVVFRQRVDDEAFLGHISSDEMVQALKDAKGTKSPRINLLDSPNIHSPVRKAMTRSTHPHVNVVVDLRDGRANDGQFIVLHNNILKAAGDFFEDEVPPTVLPLDISVVGAEIEIIEDKNPDFPPTKVKLQDTLRVTRDKDGMFSIGCPRPKQPLEKYYNGDRGSSGDNSEVLDLKNQILQLKQRVAELEKDKSNLLSRARQDGSQS